jgi:hypothetical protein
MIKLKEKIMTYLFIEDTPSQVENLKRKYNIKGDDTLLVIPNLSHLINNIYDFKFKHFDIISFDFDLGGGTVNYLGFNIDNTGEKCLVVLDNEHVTANNYLVHSMNAVGRERIIAMGKERNINVYHVLM